MATVSRSRIKVVWLCSFSDQRLRKHLDFPSWYWGNIVRSVMGMSNQNDFAVWDSNALTEIRTMTERVELHVVMPHSGINHTYEFEDEGIFFHVFGNDWDIITEKIKRKLNKRDENSFSQSRKKIKRFLDKIQPDIVHVIGIENKFYSMAVFDIQEDIPIIAQLQTLVNDPRFKASCGVPEDEYSFDSEIEKRVLLRANFIGTMAMQFREIITNTIKPNALFINTTLALAEPVVQGKTLKEFDFVYFAADISKAADLAIEAFALAVKERPNLTLDIIGGYSPEYKSVLDNRINELGIRDSISFEGKLPTHEDVICQIRKARFALLPLKIDLVSGTIRESMACGLPVVTTNTPDTPKLNEKRECVLLSDIGDYRTMAQNMLKLVNDEEYAKLLSSNCILIANEIISNKEVVKQYCDAYYDCVTSFRASYTNH